MRGQDSGRTSLVGEPATTNLIGKMLRARLLSLVLFTSGLLACARSLPELPEGTSGGPCFANETCRAGLFCVHGYCVGQDDDGLCPDDMVALVSHELCIDRYEAYVSSSLTCDGTAFGIAGLYDFPPGFPENVASTGCRGGCVGEAVVEPTVNLYACSVALHMPSMLLTWFQARRACDNVGKRLCSEFEWIEACAGAADSTYPYGDTYEPDTCNGSEHGVGGAVPTGSLSACVGSAPDLYDMSGNLWEWADNCGSNNLCHPVGGGFSHGRSKLTCHSRGGDPPLQSLSRIGFRCCRSFGGP